MLVLSQSYSKYCLARFYLLSCFTFCKFFLLLLPQEIQILVLGRLGFQGFFLSLLVMHMVGIVGTNPTLGNYGSCCICPRHGPVDTVLLFIFIIFIIFICKISTEPTFKFQIAKEKIHFPPASKQLF